MDIAEESRKYALSEIETFGLPNRTHFDISEKKALELAEKLGADKAIVRAGVALMDLKLGQAFKEGRLKEHIGMSVEAAKEFLDGLGIDDPAKEKIINCIEAHHGTVPYKCKEAEICANADCYRFVHPKGFFLYLTVLGRRNPEFSVCLDAAEKKMDEKHSVLSLDACKSELDEHYKILKQFIAEARRL
jgi:hypothetical protein